VLVNGLVFLIRVTMLVGIVPIGGSAGIVVSVSID